MRLRSESKGISSSRRKLAVAAVTFAFAAMTSRAISVGSPMGFHCWVAVLWVRSRLAGASPEGVISALLHTAQISSRRRRVSDALMTARCVPTVNSPACS